MFRNPKLVFWLFLLIFVRSLWILVSRIIDILNAGTPFGDVRREIIVSAFCVIFMPFGIIGAWKQWQRQKQEEESEQ